MKVGIPSLKVGRVTSSYYVSTCCKRLKFSCARLLNWTIGASLVRWPPVTANDTVSKLYHNNNNNKFVKIFYSMAGVGDLVCSSCKLKVDGSSDSGHMANDNTNSSCSWDTEDVSISRLHLGQHQFDVMTLCSLLNSTQLNEHLWRRC